MFVATPLFRVFQQEGHLSSSSLLGGFELLNKVNYDQPGTVYAALFQLATGLERMMKIAFIMDYRVKNGLAFPSHQQLKKFSHSLVDLYDHLAKTADGYHLKTEWIQPDSLHRDVLVFLSEFAMHSRYYNLDMLVDGRKNPDPLVRWFELHMRIAEKNLAYHKREKIMNNARALCERLGNFGWEPGPYGRWELSVDVMYQVEVANQSRGHCVWIMIQILKPIYDLIYDLVSRNHALDDEKGRKDPDVPYMYEFFPFCLGQRETVIRRKAWTTLFVIAGRT